MSQEPPQQNPSVPPQQQPPSPPEVEVVWEGRQRRGRNWGWRKETVNAKNAEGAQGRSFYWQMQGGRGCSLSCCLGWLLMVLVALALLRVGLRFVLPLVLVGLLVHWLAGPRQPGGGGS